MEFNIKEVLGFSPPVENLNAERKRKKKEERKKKEKEKEGKKEVVRHKQHLAIVFISVPARGTAPCFSWLKLKAS